jgi:hypothetical protein
VDSIWVELGRAFCLLLIIEGIMPFLYPDRWRQLLETVSETDDKVLRLVGLFSMLLGLGILYLL